MLIRITIRITVRIIIRMINRIIIRIIVRIIIRIVIRKIIRITKRIERHQDAEVKKTKLSAELANGRLAMVALMAMLFQNGALAVLGFGLAALRP